jgi:hypothetical protein
MQGISNTLPGQGCVDPTDAAAKCLALAYKAAGTAQAISPECEQLLATAMLINEAGKRDMGLAGFITELKTTGMGRLRP